MQASEGSFMGSNGAGRPSERPRQGSGKPLPRADSSKPSPATASQRSTHDRRQLFQHDQLKARLWAPRMSRFRGYRSIWSMCLTFALKGPRISTFRRRNPLKLETPNPDCVFFRSAWCALRAHSQAGGRSSSRASVQLWGESTKTQFGSETAFIRPFDPATFL